MFEQSLRNKKTAFDSDSREVRSGFEQLAAVYRVLGRSTEAEELCDRRPADTAKRIDLDDVRDAENLGECLELIRQTLGESTLNGSTACSKTSS